MKVKFIFDAQFCGYDEEIKELQSNLSDEDIKSMFPLVLGIPFNNDCSYEIMEDNVTEILSEPQKIEIKKFEMLYDSLCIQEKIYRGDKNE